MVSITASTIALALELAARQASASRRLREALIDGGDTASIRREIADLGQQVTKLAAQQAAAGNAADARALEQIEAAAAAYAADVALRLRVRLDALLPPSAPAART
jgi:hypothetical protein